MAASLADLSATASRILSLFAAQLDAQGVELPERQHVGPGQIPAWDGEQLVVNLVTVAQGQPGAPAAMPFRPPAVNFHAQFGVSIVRRVHVIDTEGPFGLMVPSSEQIGEDSAVSLQDAAALIKAATTIGLADSLVDPGEGLVYELGTLGPEGGLAANRLLLTLSVD